MLLHMAGSLVLNSFSLYLRLFIRTTFLAVSTRNSRKTVLDTGIIIDIMSSSDAVSDGIGPGVIEAYSAVGLLCIFVLGSVFGMFRVERLVLPCWKY